MTTLCNNCNILQKRFLKLTILLESALEALFTIKNLDLHITNGLDSNQFCNTIAKIVVNSILLLLRKVL